MKHAPARRSSNPLAAGLMLAALSACAPTLGLEARYGTFDVDGDIGLSTGSVSADNSVESMGIEDDDSVPSLRADFKWGTPHLTVMLQQSTHDGRGTLDADISEGGITIPAGTAVSTDFDLGLHTAYLTFDLIPGDWELGLGFGVVVMDVDLATSDGMGNRVAADEAVPIPVIAARVGVGLGPVELEALAGGVTYDIDDEDVTFLDLDVNGRLRLLGDGDRAAGWLTLGLRHASFEAEYADSSDEVAADLQFTGPYLGVRFTF
jgi:hypothetical protein